MKKRLEPLRQSRIAARQSLLETVAELKSQFSMPVLSKRAKMKIKSKAQEAVKTSTTTIARNKGLVGGAAAGIGLLFIAKPLINAFKKRKSETQNDQ